MIWPEIHYDADDTQCATFVVTGPDGGKWEAVRAERGKVRNVVEVRNWGYWLDLPAAEQYLEALQAAIAWVKREDPLFTLCKCGSGLPAINCDC